MYTEILVLADFQFASYNIERDRLPYILLHTCVLSNILVTLSETLSLLKLDLK